MKITRATAVNLSVLVLAAAPMLVLTGCEEPPPPPPPAKKAPPPPPPDPDPVELAPLMRGIDARVQFPDSAAPYDAALAEAVIAFAAGFASGDDASLGGMLSLGGRGILDSMLADGTWFEATEEIEAVRVVFLSQEPDVNEDANYGEFVLAIQEPGGAYTLGWSASETDGGWVMSPLETPEGTRPRASDWDTDSLSGLGMAPPTPEPDPLPETSTESPSSQRDTTPISDEEYAALVRGQPIFVYLDFEITSRVFADQLRSAADPAAAVFAAVADATSLSPGEVERLYESGESAVNAGELPSPDDYAAYFDFGMAQIERELETIDPSLLPDDLPEGAGEWMAFIADIFGVSTARLQRLYDQAT